MNVAPLVRRPLGCLKATLRQTRHQRLLVRQMATEASQTASEQRPPELNFYAIPDRKRNTIRTAFAVYPRSTAAGKEVKPPPTNVLDALHEAQIKKLDPNGVRTAMFSRTSPEAVKPGDVLMITHRRGGEPFAGVVMSIRRRGVDTAVLLRNHLRGTGVEMWFKIYNKNVAGIDIIKRAPKRARRARLTYLRKPKHDVGSMEALVFEWKRTRKVFSTKPSSAAAAGAGQKKGKGKEGAGKEKKK